MKVLVVTDKNYPVIHRATPEHIETIKKAGKGLDAKLLVSPADEEYKREVADADILLPTLVIPEFVIKSNVRWIHISSAGADWLPEYIKDSPIIVTNSSGVHPVPISEHVLGFMLMFGRQLHKSYKIQLLEKKWRREADGIFELHGKTVGVVGLGKIGSQIARITNAIGMRVFAVARNKHAKEEFVDRMYTYKDLDKVLAESDFVVNALPSTPETFHMFDADVFAKMKPDAYFINIGRGKTVNEKDLIAVLKKGNLAGAGLDVFENEPLSDTSELWKLDNVILTPHISGWTPAYTDRVIAIFCENLKAYLENKPLPNEVDKNRGY
jgi:phosphoglycerate dehydrogenase-like enzyme